MPEEQKFSVEDLFIKGEGYLENRWLLCTASFLCLSFTFSSLWFIWRYLEGGEGVVDGLQLNNAGFSFLSYAMCVKLVILLTMSTFHWQCSRFVSSSLPYPIRVS